MNEQMKNELFENYAKHAKDNELEILASNQCGCFFCRHLYSARDVSDWVEDNRRFSAVCPECGMDTVIGDNSGVPLSKPLLKEMNAYFFGEDAEVDPDSARKFCLRYMQSKITHKESNERLFRSYLAFLTSKGDEKATLELAKLEQSGGEFGESNFKKAEELFTLPILKTNSEALIHLSTLYLSCDDDSLRGKAYTCAAKACALGDPLGISAMADCILSGVGVEQDGDLAYAIIDNAYQDYFEWLTQDDETDLLAFENFAYRLAKYNQYGVGTEPDLDFALRLYLFAKLACLNSQELGFGPSFILPDVEKEINVIAKEKDYYSGEPIFDTNMFFDTFSFAQEEDSLKHLRVVSYDEESGTLILEITYEKPTAFIDAETLTCLMRRGPIEWTFSNVAYLHGEGGDFNRIGSNDGESWVFYRGDEIILTIRYKNGGTEGVSDE